MLQKDEIQEEFEHSDEDPGVNVETKNKFSLLSNSSTEQSISYSTPPSDNHENDTVSKEVQPEVIFQVHDCFYCDETLQSREQLNIHKEICHGRPWESFSCDQCKLKFDDVIDLKTHVVKVHDHAKLLHCLQVMFKAAAKNFRCSDCAKTFEFDSGLELHILASHVLCKERFSS